jgi:hypothetical protein
MFVDEVVCAILLTVVVLCVWLRMYLQKEGSEFGFETSY